MAGIYSQGGSAGHRYAGWLETVGAKNFQFGGKVFNGSPSAIYVGSKMVWAWLTIAAQQAIRGAFGDDGKAVINATNAYLNQLAAQGQAGKDKATALAGFINEDPMMVCSLGLQPQGVTMPIRGLRSDGKAYIITDVPSNNGLKTKLSIANVDYQGEAAFIGTTDADGMNAVGNLMMRFADTIQAATQSYYIRYVVSDLLGVHTLEIRDNNFFYDGQDVGTHNSINYGAAGYRVLFRTQPTNSSRLVCLFNMNECIYSGTSERHYIPFMSRTQGGGILDLLKVGVEGATVFLGNSNTEGSFSIAYMRNGQPWTPSTP